MTNEEMMEKLERATASMTQARNTIALVLAHIDGALLEAGEIYRELEEQEAGKQEAEQEEKKACEKTCMTCINICWFHGRPWCLYRDNEVSETHCCSVWKLKIYEGENS